MPRNLREEFWQRLREKKRQGWMNYFDWSRRFGQDVPRYYRQNAYKEFLTTVGKPKPDVLPDMLRPRTPNRMFIPKTPNQMFTPKTPTPMNAFVPQTPNVIPGRPGNIRPDPMTDYLTQRRPNRMASTIGWGG